MAFDQFYTHIETVHDLINKTKENITVGPVKIEIDEHNSKDEQLFANDEDWSFHNDIESDSDHNSIGRCQSVFIIEYYTEIINALNRMYPLH